MAIYYNDNDPNCAAWLRNLAADGRIASGIVDDRSILEVSADELAEFSQVHLFAGIGGWPYALELAGWPDDRPVWTASCPCQPFSSAGQRRGTDDERHLWPAVRHLVDELRPPALFGEQVASPLGRSWLARVRDDLDSLGYRVGAADLPAAGVGAPHIRQRLYFAAFRMADPESIRRGVSLAADLGQTSGEVHPFADHRDAGGLADTDGRHAAAEGLQRGGQHRQRQTHRRARGLAEPESIDGRRMGTTARHRGEPRGDSPQDRLGHTDSERPARHSERRAGREQIETPGAWDDGEWIRCSDERARRAQPGAFPLADGVPGRLVRLRGYGNAIVPPLAAEFIAAAEEARAEATR